MCTILQYDIKQSIFFLSPFIAFDQSPMITSHFIVLAYHALVCTCATPSYVGRSVGKLNECTQNRKKIEHEIKFLASVWCVNRSLMCYTHNGLAGVYLSAFSNVCYRTM